MLDVAYQGARVARAPEGEGGALFGGPRTLKLKLIRCSALGTQGAFSVAIGLCSVRWYEPTNSSGCEKSRHFLLSSWLLTCRFACWAVDGELTGPSPARLWPQGQRRRWRSRRHSFYESHVLYRILQFSAVMLSYLFHHEGARAACSDEIVPEISRVRRGARRRQRNQVEGCC